MVVRTAKNGFKYRGPPYSAAELLDFHLHHCGTPVAVYGRRRETPDTASQRPAAEGSEATPAPTPTASSEQSQPRGPKR